MITLNAQAASVILREGTIVSTNPGASVAWYRNIICKSSENIIWVELIVPYLENIIKTGMPISIKYFNDYFLYLFEGIVTTITTGSQAFVEITVNKAEELVNTRSYPRYDTYLACTAQTIWEEKGCFSILTNISHGGMAFMCPERFECGEELKVRLFMPGSRQVSIKGKIIDRNRHLEGYDYSLQFTSVDSRYFKVLSEYFTEQEKDISEMQEKFRTVLKCELQV